MANYYKIYLYLQDVTQKIQYSMSRIWIKIYLFFTAISFFSNGLVRAQELSNYDDLTIDDYSSLTLPPLDVLFENAKNAPSYEFNEINEVIERKKLNKEKRAFLGFFSLRGSYQYGTFTNDGSYTDIYTQPFATYNKTTQNLWSVGAGVNIPLDDLFDLGGRVKRQKLVARSYQLLKEQRFEEVKREIITYYTAAASQLNILKLRGESLVLANVEYRIVEKNFANGTTTSRELALEKERQSVTKERYESSKAELNRSLMILEIITQTPIIRK